MPKGTKYSDSPPKSPTNGPHSTAITRLGKPRGNVEPHRTPVVDESRTNDGHRKA